MCCLTMCLMLPRFGYDPKQAEQGALLEAAAESQRLRERLEGLLKEVRSCHIVKYFGFIWGGSQKLAGRATAGGWRWPSSCRSGWRCNACSRTTGVLHHGSNGSIFIVYASAILPFRACAPAGASAAGHRGQLFEAAHRRGC